MPGKIIIIMTLIILALAGFVIYKTLRVPSSPTPTPDSSVPNITLPANSKITSPSTIKGIVPPGWMFEGVFPFKLVDSEKNIIVQSQAHEDTPGSWQSGNPVNFTITLTFSTSAKKGFIILENDNASGDPARSKSLEIPVNF